MPDEKRRQVMPMLSRGVAPTSIRGIAMPPPLKSPANTGPQSFAKPS